MKILFWLLAILSIPVGLFMSFICYLSEGLGLYRSTVGQILCYLGMASVVVSIIAIVLGVKKLRKGDVKKAILLVLMGILYSGVILGGIYIDEAVDSVLHNRSIAQHDAQLYGENWDAAPAIEGIPQSYQTVLNKYYAIVRDTWPGEELMGIGAVAMADYYGDAPLDNIGFALMDLDGDGLDEMIIGTTYAPEGTGNAVFCIYSDPTNAHYSINSVEGKMYYLHADETDDTYLVEIVGQDAAWDIRPASGFDFDALEGALDPANRLTLDLIPFSQYK